MSTSDRRKFLKGGAIAAAAATAASVPARAQEKPVKKVFRANGTPMPAPAPGTNRRMSSTVTYGNLLFISGVGYHQKGDITVHTKGVLDSIKAQLEAVGSSMQKCLKANVYLSDAKDFEAMNKVYDTYFGPEPPTRTTIAAAWIPGDSLIEIDVIAYL